MNTSATNRRLRVLLSAITNGALIPQPNFQRRLVWTNKDKLAFVKTVLDGFPFPEIYIAAGSVDVNTGEGAEMLVDGQQRITTLYQYFRGSPDLKTGQEIPSYDDLPAEKKMEFLEYGVVVRDLGNMSLQQIQTVFQRINSTSYGLNAMEIHNSRYGGEFKNFAEEFSQKEFFDKNRIFTSTDVKRMQDVLYCASLTATIMTSYFNRDSEIEGFFERYNEVFPERSRLSREVDSVLFFIEKLDLPIKSRAFKKADFFTLFVELHRVFVLESNVLHVQDVREDLEAFYHKVELAAQGYYTEDHPRDYYQAALQGSNDRRNRILRGEVIYRLLRKLPLGAS